MTPVKFASYIRFITKTNSATFPDADILVLANIFKDEIAKDIAEANEDYFGMVYYHDLVADRREYPMPDEILNNIKYVEAKLDGTNWKRLREFDINSYQRATDETTIRSQFAGREPAFDIFRKSLWIYSDSAIVNVMQGLKLWAISYPADITNLASTEDMSVDPTNTSHGFPRQFHELLARRVAIAYKTSRDRPIPLSEKELLYEQDLAKAIESIKGLNLDRSIVPSYPRDTGEDY